MVVLVVIMALALDRMLPEPRRHPLAGFGRLAGALARRWNPAHRSGGIAAGGVALGLLVVPAAALAGGLSSLPAIGHAVDVAVVWLALGGGSLALHAQAVAEPLQRGDLDAARRRTGCLVSRDTTDLDAPGCARAAVESVLENGSDAVIATLFWYVAAGAPGVVAHRLVNTLDAMWGYRTARWHRFGRIAARLDDVLNWIPARLTALAYALGGDRRGAFRAWWRDAPHWDSPNAGPTMAAGAGALGLSLGDPARYHGAWRQRPALGDGRPPNASDIPRATALLDRAVLMGLAVLLGGWLLA